jgi:hypothetical protein
LSSPKMLVIRREDHSLPAAVNVLGRGYLTGRFWVSTEGAAPRVS